MLLTAHAIAYLFDVQILQESGNMRVDHGVNPIFRRQALNSVSVVLC